MDQWADLWEAKVREGMSEADATAFVTQAQKQPSAPKPEAPARPAWREKIGEIMRAGGDLAGAATGPAGIARAAANPTARGIAASAVNGATFGWGDEAVGVVSPGARDMMRADMDQLKTEHPIAQLLSELAGGMATGGAGAKMLKAAGVGAGAARGSMLAKAAKSAAGGGVGGAVYGAGAAEDGHGGEGAIVGGGVGALTGGVLSGALDVGGKLWQGGLSLTRRPASAAAATAAPAAAPAAAGPTTSAATAATARVTQQPVGPIDSGARRLLERARQNGWDLDEVERRINAGQSPDIVAEAMGERGIRDLRTARMLGKTSPDVIEDGLTRRARDEVGRVQGAAETAFGGGALDKQGLSAAKLAEAQRASGPLYRQAMDGVNITDPKAFDLLRRPSLASAYAEARRQAADDGIVIPSLKEIFAKAKPVGKELADVDAPTARMSAADAAGTDATRGMTQKELGSVRKTVRKGDLSKLSDADLDAEHMYLLNEQGADQAKAAIRESSEYAEYLSLRDLGLKEDARGIMEQMGYHDPVAFNQNIARDASLAEGKVARRAPRIQAIEDELARRREQFGDVPGDVSDAAGTATMPGRDMVAVPDEGAQVPTLPAKAVQYWKFAIDDKIKAIKGKTGGKATNRTRQLVQLRNEVENLLFEHGNKAEDGSSLWGQAQAAYAKPMQEAEAFAQGQKVGRTMKPADVQRMVSGKNADWTARGVGNTILEDLQGLQSGGAGTVRNPAPAVMGSDVVDARVRVAARGNAARIKELQDIASGASRRLRTRNIVTGGSQTADKASDAADAAFDPGFFSRLMGGNVGGAAGSLAGKALVGAGKSLLGDDMDAMARYLMAGSHGQMTKAEAINQLRIMAPRIREEIRRQVTTRSAAGAYAGNRAAGG